jgi:hypothetical protein
MSILIKPSLVHVKLWLIRGQAILIISKKPLLLSSGSLFRDHRLNMSQRRRRAGKLAREKIPKMKSTHVQTHARNPVMIVGAVEEHRASQHWDNAWRSRRRNHDDDESGRAAAAARTLKFYLRILLCLVEQDETTKKKSRKTANNRPARGSSGGSTRLPAQNSSGGALCHRLRAAPGPARVPWAPAPVSRCRTAPGCRVSPQLRAGGKMSDRVAQKQSSGRFF